MNSRRPCVIVLAISRRNGRASCARSSCAVDREKSAAASASRCVPGLSLNVTHRFNTHARARRRARPGGPARYCAKEAGHDSMRGDALLTAGGVAAIIMRSSTAAKTSGIVDAAAARRHAHGNASSAKSGGATTPVTRKARGRVINIDEPACSWPARLRPTAPRAWRHVRCGNGHHQNEKKKRRGTTMR